MSISPVFQNMLHTSDEEQNEEKNQLKEVLIEETSTETMKYFLEAISPRQINPNRKQLN